MSAILGAIFALLSAAGEAARSIVTRRSMPHANTMSLTFLSGLTIFVFTSWSLLSTTITPYLAMLALVGGLLEAVALWCFFRASQIGELSRAGPLTALTPIFALLIGIPFLGEIPSVTGIIGVFLGIAGAYIISLKRSRTSWTDPFHSIIADRGSRYMLIAAIVWGATTVIGKAGVLASSRLSWLALVTGSMALFAAVSLFVSKVNPVKTLRIHPFAVLVIGLLWLGANFAIYTSFLHLQAAYAVAVQRSMAIFIALYGFIWLKERVTREKLVGMFLLVASGVVIAVL